MTAKDFDRDFVGKVFEEWKTRYDADPAGFQSHAEFDADLPETYGNSAMQYFLWLWDELKK